MINLPHAEIFLRLVVALILGGLIGLERQWKQRTAGLRTNALVSLGSAAFAILACSFPGLDSQARIISYIISSIGFLGTGVIMKDGNNVKGINTAATLWCSAGIGLFAGTGEFSTATLISLVLIVTNLIMYPIIKFVNKRPLVDNIEAEFFYAMNLICRRKEETGIRELLLEKIHAAGINIKKISSSKIEYTDNVEVHVSMISIGNNSIAIEEIVSAISLNPSIRSASWSNKNSGD